VSVRRVFTPLMAVAALGLSSAAVVPASAVASGSQIITCQKHGGKASLAHGGKCKSGETKTAWQSTVPSPKTSAIYTCKSSSGSERLVAKATKCSKHERKLTWYQVKPAPSKSGTLGTNTVVPPVAATPTPVPAQPAAPQPPAKPTNSPRLEKARAKLKEVTEAEQNAGGAVHNAEAALVKAEGEYKALAVKTGEAVVKVEEAEEEVAGDLFNIEFDEGEVTEDHEEIEEAEQELAEVKAHAAEIEAEIANPANKVQEKHELRLELKEEVEPEIVEGEEWVVEVKEIFEPEIAALEVEIAEELAKKANDAKAVAAAEKVRAEANAAETAGHKKLEGEEGPLKAAVEHAKEKLAEAEKAAATAAREVAEAEAALGTE
jgi:hypothetical protein